MNKEDANDQVESHFKTLVSKVFGNSASFGFIFGSYAKKKVRNTTNLCSDIDTFICVEKHQAEKEQEFIEKIVQFQIDCGYKPDLNFPSEIFTEAELDNSIKLLVNPPTFSLSDISFDLATAIFLSEIFVDFKSTYIHSLKVEEYTDKFQVPNKFIHDLVRSKISNCSSLTELLNNRYPHLTLNKLRKKLDGLDKEMLFRELIKFDMYSEIGCK